MAISFNKFARGLLTSVLTITFFIKKWAFERFATIRFAVADILKNLDSHNSFDIGNRALAIRSAILNSDPNEIVLIAGKGHEKFQDVNGKQIHFDEKLILKKIVQKSMFLLILF